MHVGKTKVFILDVFLVGARKRLGIVTPIVPVGRKSAHVEEQPVEKSEGTRHCTTQAGTEILCRKRRRKEKGRRSMCLFLEKKREHDFFIPPACSPCSTDEK